MTASDDGGWPCGITSDSVDDARPAGVTGLAGEPVRTDELADELADESASAVAALDTKHESVTLEMTGPWPPYSFAGIDRANP
jgi:hypothetical protein